LFLSGARGSALGVILAVLGVVVWFGAQRLRYSGLSEGRQVARHAVEQRSISLKDVSIRRAAEDLKVAPDYAKLCGILESAFSSTDFDGFDLDAKLLPEDYERSPTPMLLTAAPKIQFKWIKSPHTELHDDLSTWSLTLDLITSENRRRGSMRIFRRYNQGPLRVDLNFLTSVFPVVLADALDRVLTSSEVPSDGARGKRISLTSLSTFYHRCRRKHFK